MQGADDVINEQELMQSIDNFLSENKEAMLADLKTLIGQPSVRGEAAPGAPYGTDVNAALEKALAIARRMGLETENCAGNIGWADLPGKSKLPPSPIWMWCPRATDGLPTPLK